MHKSFAFLFFLFSAFSVRASAVCLDISGTYELDPAIHVGIIPACASNRKSTAAWMKIEQSGCISVAQSDVYKLDDGTYCETAMALDIADGVERPIPGLNYNEKYDIFEDRHVGTWISRSTGYKLFFFKTLDSSGNLVIGYDPGTVYRRSPIR